MSVPFPATLDCTVLPGSYAERRRSHFTEFQTDSGKPLRSKYAGTPLTDVSFERVYSLDQWRQLEAFYATDCGEGVTSFTMAHPRQGDLRVFSWADAPTLQHISGDHYQVSFSLLME